MTDKLIKILQDSVDDPMWPDHVEMPKRILRVVIERLNGVAQAPASAEDAAIEIVHQAREIYENHEGDGAWIAMEVAYVELIRAALSTVTSTHPWPAACVFPDCECMKSSAAVCKWTVSPADRATPTADAPDASAPVRRPPE